MNHKIVRIIFVVFLLVLTMSIPLFADAIGNWGDYEVKVRDGLTNKTTAKVELGEIINDIRGVCSEYEFSENHSWVFPLKGYGLNSIAAKGSDFRPDCVYGVSPIRGYDFFDGNRHGGHPAHDIFIRDKNQDMLDDRTGAAVEAVAMVDCVVLSDFTGWQKGSKLRGGNYIWLYNPKLDMFFYYAHLDKVLVTPGDFVKAGTVIGTVGRTGLLAAKKTSPTHIHLMGLKYSDGAMKPYEYYGELKNAMH